MAKIKFADGGPRSAESVVNDNATSSAASPLGGDGGAAPITSCVPTAWPPSHLCPRCAGDMRIRVNGRTGDVFWGCNEFPNCVGTRPVDELFGAWIPDPWTRRGWFIVSHEAAGDVTRCLVVSAERVGNLASVPFSSAPLFTLTVTAPARDFGRWSRHNARRTPTEAAHLEGGRLDGTPGRVTYVMRRADEHLGAAGVRATLHVIVWCPRLGWIGVISRHDGGPAPYTGVPVADLVPWRDPTASGQAPPLPATPIPTTTPAPAILTPPTERTPMTEEKKPTKKDTKTGPRRFVDAMARGAVMGVTDQVGDTLIAMARKMLPKDNEAVEALLATPAGREFVKLTMAGLVQQSALLAPVPGGEHIARAAEQQIAFSAGKLTSAILSTAGTELAALAQLGAQLAALPENAERRELEPGGLEDAEVEERAVAPRRRAPSAG